MSDRWTDETAELVALATGAHHLDPNWTDADGHSRCVCGGWVDGEMNPGWDDHMAEVSLTALADAGLLATPLTDCIEWGEEIEPNTVLITARSTLTNDPNWRPLRRDPSRRLMRRRFVTFAEHATPWREVPGGE
jgi:hypothetical protein